MLPNNRFEAGASRDLLSIVLEATADLNEMLAEPDRLYASLLGRLRLAVPFSSGSLQVVDGGYTRIVAVHGGLDPDMVIGLRFALDSRYPNDEVVRTKRPVAFDDVRAEYPVFVERKDELGSGHIRSWLGAPLVAAGSVVGMLALDRDEVDPFGDGEVRIVQAFADNAAVAFRNARTYRELQDALASRDALMRETNHRVKNNLQLVSGLISMHAGRVEDAKARENLAELQARIATISSIHERLYRCEDNACIELDDYLRGIAEDVFGSFHRPDSGVALETDLDAIQADPGAALPLGLIANELIVNALKYAFPAGGGGTVSVRLRRVGAFGELSVSDTGVGMAPGAESSGGFGIELVESLAEQADGRAELEPGPGGTAWTIKFPVA